MGEPTSRLAFCDEFRSRLERGKYTRWAADLPLDSLESLLWMIGEYAIRDACLRRDPSANTDRARMRVGLENITRIFEGERFDLEEAMARIRRVLTDSR
jgi:hypothetical protein